MLRLGASLAIAAVLVGCGSESSQGLSKRATGGAAGDSGVSSGGTNGGGSSGVVTCASDKTCTPLGKLCDPVARRCVDCVSDADCTGGPATCRAGHCQAKISCKNSLDCASAPDGRLICDAAAGDCVQCTSNADCDQGYVCAARSCVPHSAGGVGGGVGVGGAVAMGGAMGFGGSPAGGYFAMGGSFATGGFFAAGGSFATGGASPGGAGGVGGSSGAPAGTPCTTAAACESQTCAGGICQPPSCNDGVLDGGETGTDCGGPCALCRNGNSCTSGATCASGTCTVSGSSGSSVCSAAPSCTNGVQDGTETDVDCGGLACPKCSAAMRCRTPGDCNTHVCNGGICATCNPQLCPATSLSPIYPPCCTTAGACSAVGNFLTICL